jgi:putative N6-adenine-specific DNA methylase
MTGQTRFDIFLITAPGLEGALCDELHERGFGDAGAEVGGVTIKGGWPDVWRANLEVRGASRILARIGSFRVVHLSQLDKLARRFDWSQVLRRDVPVRVEATCKRSKIYHAGAVKQRVETAIRDELGAPISADAGVRVRARVEDNVCTLSIDTSGELLHKRGHKEAVSKAPIRETLASLFLRQCGYDGMEPVLDPMCGSGTFVLEAAEIAAGLAPGRSRDFAFEQLAGFDKKAWQSLHNPPPTADTDLRFYGSDRDAGTVRMSTANAIRADVSHLTSFEQQTVKDLQCPEGPTGLVMVNPPYGGRIGSKAQLHTLYRNLGLALRNRFSGWRVGMVTTEIPLAEATGLPFEPPGPFIDHGGLKIRLFKTGVLK